MVSWLAWGEVLVGQAQRVEGCLGLSRAMAMAMAMAKVMAIPGKLHFPAMTPLSPRAQAVRTCRLKLKCPIYRPAGMA